MKVLFGGYPGDRNNNRGGYDRLGFRPLDTRSAIVAEEITFLAPVAQGVGVEIESLPEDTPTPGIEAVIPEPREEAVMQNPVAAE